MTIIFLPLCKVFFILFKLGFKIVKATFVNSLLECFCTYIHHIIVHYKLNLICQYTIALSIRFGLSIYTFQGLFLYYLLLYASVSDLTDRRVADHLSVSVLALSLISVPTVGIISMLIGGAVSFAIQTGVSVFSGGRYGGADIKISSACVFLLGWSRGLIGLALGLLTGVLFTLIYNKIKKRSSSEGFALVPFISFGMMVAFFL